MIKQKVIATIFLAGYLFLSSCGTSVSSQLIAQKNNERLIDAAKDTTDENRRKLSDLQSEKYDYSFTSSDGNVIITADADVILPGTDSVPMYQVSSSTFSQEQASAVFDLLFEGKDAWRYPEGSSFQKSDADAYLKEYQDQIDSIKANPDMGEGEKQRNIAVLQYQINEILDEYNDLPNTIEKLPVDGTFFSASTKTANGDQSYRCLVANSDDGSSLEIRDFGDCGLSISSLIYTSNIKRPDYIPLDGDIDSCSCRYSPEEAQDIASRLLDVMGVENQIVWSGIACKDFSETGEPLSLNAYAFYFTRLINGVPIATTTCEQSYHNESSEHWLYEKILICVDDDGIASVKWNYPAEENEIVSENVYVVPFSSAAEIFEQMSPLIWQGNIVDFMKTSLYDIQYRIEVNRIELNLVRVRNSGGLSGIYTPAWVFYGKETRISKDPRNGNVYEDTENSPWIIMAINAVDCSIIDIIAGY